MEMWLARAKNPASGLEAELKKAGEKIKQLEHELQEEKKMWQIIKVEQVVQTDTRENVIMMMATEKKNLQKGRESQLSDGKEKVLKETLEKLAVAEDEKNKLAEKLEETTKDKEKGTETVNTLKKVVEPVGSNIDDQKANKTKKIIMCRNVNKPEGCKWGDKCNVSHGESGRLVEQDDCSLWLEGQWRFSSKVVGSSTILQRREPNLKYPRQPTRRFFKKARRRGDCLQGWLSERLLLVSWMAGRK